MTGKLIPLPPPSWWPCWDDDCLIPYSQTDPKAVTLMASVSYQVARDWAQQMNHSQRILPTAQNTGRVFRFRRGSFKRGQR